MFRKLVFTFIGVALLAAAVIDVVPFRSVNLTAAGAVWTAAGSFTKAGTSAGAKFDIGIPERERRSVDFWSGHAGELRSPVFPAPAVFECFLAGHPGEPGVRLYLERVADRQEFALTIAGNRFPGKIWRAFHWRVPSAFRGQMVQLVAVDSGEWLGVSTPRRFSYLGLLHQQMPRGLSLLGRTVLALAVFLLPGFAGAFWLISRWPPLLRYALILIVAGSATLGYAAFYVYFFLRAGGPWFSLAIAAASLALTGLAFRRGALLKTIARQVAEPFLLTGATAVCYLCFAYLFVSSAGGGADYINGRFFRFTLPGDNVIPRIFAEKIYNREPIRPFCCGDWLSSDRPPLQTGIFLLERPAPWIQNADFEYEVLGTVLQCLWIAGVWAFPRSLGTALPAMRRAVLFLIFSGPIFFNCVYPWPKFLTATFLLFAVSVVIEKLRDRSVAEGPAAVIGGVCLGLALVSHPGSIYSLAAFSILLFRFRRRLRVRPIFLAVPVVLAFVLPWMAYQKFVDPPGNRLIKWHLAGHPEPDSLSAWQEVRHAYESHTPAEILALRWGNLQYLFGGPMTYPSSEDRLEDARQRQREFFFQAIGVLNIGFIALMAGRRMTTVVPFAGWIVLGVLVNLVIWCGLEFGPRMTPLVHGSYADFLMLSAGLLGYVLALPRVWVVCAFVLQVVSFGVVWVWSPPDSAGVVLQVPLLVLGVGIAVGLVAWLVKGVEMSIDTADTSVPATTSLEVEF